MPILTRRLLLFAPAVVAAASLMPVRLWRVPSTLELFRVTGVVYLANGTCHVEAIKPEQLSLAALRDGHIVSSLSFDCLPRIGDTLDIGSIIGVST